MPSEAVPAPVPSEARMGWRGCRRQSRRRQVGGERRFHPRHPPIRCPLKAPGRLQTPVWRYRLVPTPRDYRLQSYNAPPGTIGCVCKASKYPRCVGTRRRPPTQGPCTGGARCLARVPVQPCACTRASSGRRASRVPLHAPSVPVHAPAVFRATRQLCMFLISEKYLCSIVINYS